MWDQRYNTDDYVYGTQPNVFLAAQMARIPIGRVLCLAEGEGRNGVFLAEHGFQVTAIDSSCVGLAKAQRLAVSRGVKITTEIADLAEFVITPGAWDAVVSIFCHVPAHIRERIHRQVVAGLRPGGAFILEAYTPAQLDYGTGGPPVAGLMMDLECLRQELSGLAFVHGLETVREVREGQLHTGPGAVVQVLAFKP